MSQTPKVLLLMIPFAGFDRGLLEGIVRYTRLNGPWVLYSSGDYHFSHLRGRDSLGRKFSGREYVAEMVVTAPLPDLRHRGATGVIGRIPTAKIARTILAAKLPIVGIDLSDEQLSAGNPLSRVSEIRADSRKAGRTAAEHFLDRGFRHFAFIGYPKRNWSQGRREGFQERLREAGYDCDVYQPARLKRGVTWEWEHPQVIPG